MEYLFFGLCMFLIVVIISLIYFFRELYPCLKVNKEFEKLLFSLRLGEDIYADDKKGIPLYCDKEGDRVKLKNVTYEYNRYTGKRLSMNFNAKCKCGKVAIEIEKDSSNKVRVHTY